MKQSTNLIIGLICGIMIGLLSSIIIYYTTLISYGEELEEITQNNMKINDLETYNSLNEKTGDAINGVWFKHSSFCVDMNRQNIEAIKNTLDHEYLHELLNNEHLCGNETCWSHFCDKNNQYTTNEYLIDQYENDIIKKGQYVEVSYVLRILEGLRIWWLIVKINPEQDIIEHLEWIIEWEQLFTWEAAQRELEKKWLRFLNYKDFQSIIKKFWIDDFFKIFPGFYNNNNNKFLNIGYNIFLWTFFNKCNTWVQNISIVKGENRINFCWKYKDVLLSTYWIKK